MTTALFVCGSHREASHWAEAWGFGERDWHWVKAERDVWGRRNPADHIVFVCGTMRIPPNLLDALHAAGYDTFVDAHDHPTDAEPRSALQLVA